jgi:cysteine desulfurase
MNKIYFDHAATMPVDEDVLSAMWPYFGEKFGNSSSLHSMGQETSKAINEAREIVADFLGCDFDEVIFTSGSTESNNMLIKGLVSRIVSSGDLAGKSHVVISAMEHPAILDVCKKMKTKNEIELDIVAPQEDGILLAGDVLSKIKENTILVSIMYANNETGAIQPIAQIGEKIEVLNENRENKIFFHTDATQAPLYLDMSVNNLKVDSLSFSGHKIYGPKGVGALYLSKDLKVDSLLDGGHQEFGKRAGTVNTPLIVGMGKATQMIKTRNHEKMKGLRGYLWQEIQDKIEDVKLNGDLAKTLPGVLNISIKKTEGEALLLGLDMEGIAVSTGSACSAGSLEPSHVLMSMNLSHEESHGSLRISLGKDNTKEEVDYFLEKFIPLVEKIRRMAPDFE